MRPPRFRVRTLMVAVAVAAALCGTWSVIEDSRERTRWATVRIINRRSVPLSKVRVIYPDGAGEAASVPAGEEAQFPIRIETEARVRVEVGGRRYAEWWGVRGGSRPTLTLSD